ncbi:oligopeptide transport system permease protein AppB [Treponema primitia ZAS-2]|uniref:Oligopeptide transport system permease protein AppB n=1 Tax=Treponema primitia (strain ATCC BAA-887 / DSM 12427 / ZAS-2) TaxID=545694 RepID=F5YM05_TREPZ|nr:ABC transporter permease [Treponema primitia]AEF83901.1 oligopeptide transport system permease protein AppB [Treponema primitia ZAS-2]
MGKYLLGRLVRGVITFFIAATITFLILRLMPSDPATIMMDPRMSQLDRDLMLHNFGLDRPVPVQYAYYLKNMLHGDLGLSFSTRAPVGKMLMERIPWTLLLMVCVIINCFIWGIPIGVVAAKRRNTWLDRFINVFTVIGTSIFVPSLGVSLLYLFGLKFPILPIGGTHTPGVTGVAYVIDVVRHMILPIFTLTFVNLANYVWYMRASMIEILNEDYMRTARSKGMTENRAVWRHGVRNALIPTVTMTGLLMGAMVGGSILTETVYSYPGVGRLIYEAVQRLDFPVLQGAFLMLSFVVILLGVVVDILYITLDPRINLS